MYLKGPETRIITNLFKNSNIEISFRTTNTIKKPPKIETPNERHIHTNWCISIKMWQIPVKLCRTNGTNVQG
jgi:hypothetical protein